MKLSDLIPLPRDIGSLLGWLALYVAVFFSLRLIISSTVGVDDVEQAVMAQSWEWVYNPDQPPLYTWIAYSLFKLSGVSLFSLTLLRYGLMLLTFLFLYLSARRLMDDPLLAGLAAFSPLLIYYVGWGAHLGFTHTALLAAFCCATFYSLLRLVDTGSWAAYAVFGLLLGLGMNSKYSFALLASGLILACLAQPLSRRRVLSPRFLLSVAIAAAITLPPLLWLAERAGSIDAFLALYAHQDVPYHGTLPRAVFGIWQIVRVTVAFLFPWWLIVPALFPQALRKLPPVPVAGFDAGRLLGHYLMLAYGLLLAGVLSGKLIHFSTRWMHPLLILLPLYYFHRVSRAGTTPKQERRFALWLLGAGVVTAVLFGMQGWVGPRLCGKCRWFEPYAELAEKIAAAGFTQGTIIADDEHIAGNFRMHFPDSRLIAVPYASYLPPPTSGPGQCLLVWNRGRKGDSIPPEMEGILRSQPGYTPGGQGRVEHVEGQNHALRDRPLFLAYILLPAGAGGCP